MDAIFIGLDFGTPNNNCASSHVLGVCGVCQPFVPRLHSSSYHVPSGLVLIPWWWFFNTIDSINLRDGCDIVSHAPEAPSLFQPQNTNDKRIHS